MKNKKGLPAQAGIAHIAIILIILAIGVIALIAADSLTLIRPLTIPITLEVEKSNRTNEVLDWKTYTNKELNYAISFPPDYSVYENKAALPNGEPVGNLTVTIKPTNEREGFVMINAGDNAYAWEVQGYKDKVNDTFLGLPAYIKKDLDNQQYVEDIYFSYPQTSDYYHIVYGYAPAETISVLRQILSTFEFTKTNYENCETTLNGEWVEEANTCYYTSPVECETLGGDFQDCLGLPECLNTPDNVCLPVCVEGCQFE